MGCGASKGGKAVREDVVSPEPQHEQKSTLLISPEKDSQKKNPVVGTAGAAAAGSGASDAPSPGEEKRDDVAKGDAASPAKEAKKEKKEQLDVVNDRELSSGSKFTVYKNSLRLTYHVHNRRPPLVQGRRKRRISSKQIAEEGPTTSAPIESRQNSKGQEEAGRGSAEQERPDAVGETNANKDSDGNGATEQTEQEVVVVQHGFCNNKGTHKDLIEGLVAKEYCVIAVDAIGSGESHGAAALSSYSRSEMANHLCAVLDAERVKRAHFIGYSIGAWIVISVVRHAPERMLSATIGGHDPEGWAMTPWLWESVMSRVMTSGFPKNWNTTALKMQLRAMKDTEGSEETLREAVGGGALILDYSTSLGNLEFTNGNEV